MAVFEYKAVECLRSSFAPPCDAAIDRGLRKDKRKTNTG